MTDSTHDPLAELTLGKNTEYANQYDPSLLQAVPRSLNRKELSIVERQPFTGEDIWTGYELSWLNAKGKPQVAILTATVPYNSPNIVESKSFKLYLNSFTQWRLESKQQLVNLLQQDLSACAGAEVEVKVHDIGDTQAFQIQTIEAELIDDLDIDVENYQLTPALLSTHSQVTSTTLVSHLLKSNCLITNQPDWASVVIRYQGREINTESLLRYLIGFRQHNEFHEQCVERIFCDIMQHCKPEKLSVYARYTRRGGLDINPFRSNFETCYGNLRLVRQ